MIILDLQVVLFRHSFVMADPRVGDVIRETLSQIRIHADRSVEKSLALMQGVPSHQTKGIDTNGVVEYQQRGHERWQADHKRLVDLPIQYYRIVFDPPAVDIEESVVGDVCYDLADIYGQLWHGLQAYISGDIGYAIDHWRTSYDQHWGNHATGQFARSTLSSAASTRRTITSTGEHEPSVLAVRKAFAHSR